MKTCKLVLAVVFGIAFLIQTGMAAAFGPFGAPEPAPKEGSGYRVGIGYWHAKEKFEFESVDLKIKQNQPYIELARSFANAEVMARIGVSDAKTLDFDSNWKPFGTIGMKMYFPLGGTFGVGPIVQGSYVFSDYSDTVFSNDAPDDTRTPIDMKMKNFWDIRAGLAFQAKIAPAAKIYAGPFAYYSRTKIEMDLPPGEYWEETGTSTASATARNKSKLGGFAGAELVLDKKFIVNVEGQYSNYFSAGASVSYLF